MNEPTDHTDRRRRFEGELRAIRLKRGPAGREHRWALVGAAALLTGTATAAVAFIVSLRLADTRDVVSMVVLAGFALCLTTAGAVVYLRHALTRTLRLALLRLLYDDDERDGDP